MVRWSLALRTTAGAMRSVLLAGFVKLPKKLMQN